MSFKPHVWDQLRNLTAAELISAFRKDLWAESSKQGSAIAFRKADGRTVSIHFHSKKTFGAKMLQGILADAGWTEDDLRRLKLIK